MRIVLTVFLMVFAACDTASTGASGDYICTNAPTIKNPQGGVHGAPCVKDADCLYGSCGKSALQLNGHVTTTEGVCTKDCACGSAASQCDLDNEATASVAFTCIKSIESATGGTTSECAIQCDSLADCTKINPRVTVCTDTSDLFETGVKVCSIE